jgi:hypothetical protein
VSICTCQCGVGRALQLVIPAGRGAPEQGSVTVQKTPLPPTATCIYRRTVPVLCWSSCIWRLPAGCGAAVQAPPSAMPPCYAGPALRLVLLVSAPVQAPPTVPKTPLPSPPSRIYPHTLPVLCWSSTASGDAYSLGGSSAGPFNCDNTLPTPSPPLAWFTVCHGSTGIYPPTHLASVVLVQCCVW